MMPGLIVLIRAPGFPQRTPQPSCEANPLASKAGAREESP